MGQRIHRKGAIKECQEEVGPGRLCNETETLKHRLLLCSTVEECYAGLKGSLIELLGCDLKDDHIVCLSFNHRNKKKLQVVIWAAIKILFLIYSKKITNKIKLWKFMCDEIVWHLEMNNLVGSRSEMIILKKYFEKEINNG